MSVLDLDHGEMERSMIIMMMSNCWVEDGGSRRVEDVWAGGRRPDGDGQCSEHNALVRLQRWHSEYLDTVKKYKISYTFLNCDLSGLNTNLLILELVPESVQWVERKPSCSYNYWQYLNYPHIPSHQTTKVAHFSCSCPLCWPLYP